MRKLFTLLNHYSLFFIFLLLGACPGFSQTATFTSSGTWTCPAGVTSITVECWGGGGAGGSATSNNSAGAGGGGGAFNRSISVPVTPGLTYNIVVGVGGIGAVSQAGGNGGNSYFNINTATANGGAGGSLNNGTGGAGGTGGLYTGGSGGAGGSSTSPGSGGGGGSAGASGNGGNANGAAGGTAGTGGGGIGGDGFTSYPNGGSTNGNNGASPGAGGGGARKGNNGGDVMAGGNGADGLVKITWTCPSYNVLSSATTATTVCSGNGSTITLTSSTLPSGIYSVNYTLTGANTGTTSASMSFTAGSPGTGSFTTGSLSNAGATTITLNSLTSGTTTGTVSGATNCNSNLTSNHTANFTVNTSPGQPSSITGNASACAAGTEIYSVTNVPGITYTWNIPAVGWSIVSGQGTNSVTYTVGGASGTVSVTPSSGGCNGAAQTLAVSVSGSVPGTYSVGPTGNFTTLTNALTAVQSVCAVPGAYVFELQSTYNASSEGFPINIYNASWMSATNRVTIRPAAGATNLSISSSNSTGTLTLNGATYFYFDGRAGGAGTNRNLTIANTSSSGHAIQFLNNSQYNNFKYCNVTGVNTTTSEGVIHFSTSASAGNGNSYNTIENCDLGAGATTPLNMIYSAGTAGRNNAYNVIANNNIHDFFSSGGEASGVELVTASTDWTVSGNSFYQTANRTSSGSNRWMAVYLNNNTNGSNCQFLNNYIGGTAPQCGGSAMNISQGAIAAFKIKGNPGPGTPNVVQGNTISNIIFTTSSTSVNPLIYHVDGAVNITNNIIGSQTIINSIQFSSPTAYTSTSWPTISGIMAGGALVSGNPEATIGGQVNITGNMLGGISTSATGSGYAEIRGIDIGQVFCTFNVTGNTVGSPTVANSISTSAPSSIFGIVSFGDKTGVVHTINNNTVSNLTCTHTGNASEQRVVGIQAQATAAGGVYEVMGNTVFNLTSATSSVLRAVAAGIRAVNNSAASNGTIIANNLIYNLSNTNAGALANLVLGIEFLGPATADNRIYNNRIYQLSLASTGSAGRIFGIYMSNGTASVYNNMVSLGYNSLGNVITDSYRMEAIAEVSPATGNAFYYNSLAVAGSGVTGTANSFAFASTTTSAKILKNNIFYNTRSNGAGTGKHYAAGIAGTANFIADNNNYYVSGTGGVTGLVGGADQSTFAAWQSATGGDVYSVNAAVSFVNPATDLHLTAAPSTVNFEINNEGTPIAGITTDFDGNTRNTYTPDPGFDEFIGTGSWVGKNSSVWEVSGNGGAGGNWEDGVVPTTVLHAKVSNAPNQPTINATTGTALVNDLRLKTPAHVTVSQGSLKIAGNIVNRSGNITATNGTIEFNGSSAQSFSGSYFTGRTIKNLILSNAVGVSLTVSAGDSVKISSSLSFGNVNNSLFTTNHNLVLLSTASETAALADLTNGGANTGNSVTGNVTVERYIGPGRKWRFLSFPTYGQTFKQSWQEGATSAAQNPKPGYGMYITDNLASWSSNGFDAQSAGGPTIKTYNAIANTWDGIANTNSIVSTQNGLMTFVRGHRGNAVASSITSATILRSKGTLYQHTQPAIPVPSNTLVSIGNPYAAAVDLRLLDKSGTTDFFYVWDPKLSGNYSVGGYQLFSKSGANYVVTPGGGSYGTPGAISNYIESGQAFFIRGAGSAGTVTFKENAKAYGNAWVPYFTQGQSQDLRITLAIPTADTALVADGVFVNYNNSYDNAVDWDDATKFANANENVTLKRNNILLSVERRKEITAKDTLFLNLSGLRVQAYQWEIEAGNLDAPGRMGFLIDRYLQTQVPLNLNGKTKINFNVENVPASYAADRYIIVFDPTSPVPVTITQVAANRTPAGVQVQWKTENEISISKYEIERSAESRVFSAIGQAGAKSNNGQSASYLYDDLDASAGDNFYRIKATSSDGQVQYSATVKVSALKTPASITVYPNPVVDKRVNLVFNQQEPGIYTIQLSNKQGQVVYNGNAQVLSTAFAKTISLPATIPPGSYQLSVSGNTGTKTVVSIMLQ